MAWDPWRPFFVNLRDRLEETFAELLHDPWSGESAASWQPAVDVTETADAYEIEAELPGVGPEDVHIELRGHWLTICGRRQRTQTFAQGSRVHVERSFGSFCRSVFLAHAAASDRVTTRYENGIFRIHLPKVPARLGGRPESV